MIEPECTSKLPHQKGKFLGLTIDKVPDVHNPALFECSVCHGEYFDSISQEDINMPVLFIDGDLSGISKETKKKVVAAYSDEKQSFRLNATLKLQGATSLSYPKKNYNIQFFKDESYSAKQKVQFVESWGKQNKYTLKANWVDYSAMRNVVSAKIYGDIVHSRNIDDQINALTNGGAVDGFPILLYENGCYQGLYTLNTSKDDYLFGMKGGATAREALLMMNDWSKTGQLREHVPEEIGPSWELEYASTEDDEEIGVTWVSESFNAMMDFVNDNDGQTFIDGIGTYVNVPRTIDSMLYTWAMQAFDNISKNILWVTYDGTQWFSSVYDLDGTWGLAWDGVFHPNGTKAWIADWGNALWEKLFKNMHDEVIERWRELRAGPLSIGNIDKRFVDFYMSIPGELYRSERMKWTKVPSQTTNHVTQIVNHAIESLTNLDVALGVNTESLGAYKVSFECDEGANVRAYLTGDYSMDPNRTEVAYSRHSDSGYLASSDGQVNFEVVVPEGYVIDEIAVNGLYKNLKGPKDTGVANVYRITKIASDLTVSIKTVQA